MRSRYFFLALAACADEPIEATGPPYPNGCIEDVSAGTHDYPCRDIVFTAMIPATCVTGGCGIILDIHGGTMSAAMEDANTNMRALGEANEYIVIQPSAGEPPASYWESTDDAAIVEFLQSAITAWAADEDRVHATGFSQGGAMSWRLMCDYPEYFASVAPAAGAPGCRFSPAARRACFHTDDVPTQKMPILYMHGRLDGLADFECGQSAIERVLAGWTLTTSTTIDSSAMHRHMRHTGANGELVEFIHHDYVTGPTPLAELILGSELEGHCYPGSSDQGDAVGQLFPFGCLGMNAFTWGERAMEFFLANPRE